MRVGILTLHLHVNYGGILQAAALYRFLEDHGCDPVLLRKEPENYGRLGRIVRMILRSVPFQDLNQIRSREKARARHYPFIRRFMPKVTPVCHNSRELRAVAERFHLDAVVVGSDQVWRLEYHQDANSLAYFLDFVPSTAKKISYAASFGHSAWQYPEKQNAVASLLADFDAVSVREVSGIDICQNQLQRSQCDLVLDPTLLVDPSFYYEAAAPSKDDEGHHLATYILDRSPGADAARASIQEALGGQYRTTALSAHGAGEKVSVGRWLRTFIDARFVVTDSFHGTVFAILFEKDFIALGNKRRGLDRFTTLLDQLGLSDRLILDYDLSTVPSLTRQPIDFIEVNARLRDLRASSKEFLLRSLDVQNKRIKRPAGVVMS